METCLDLGALLNDTVLGSGAFVLMSLLRCLAAARLNLRLRLFVDKVQGGSALENIADNTFVIIVFKLESVCPQLLPRQGDFSDFGNLLLEGSDGRPALDFHFCWLAVSCKTLELLDLILTKPFFDT